MKLFLWSAQSMVVCIVVKFFEIYIIFSKFIALSYGTHEAPYLSRYGSTYWVNNSKSKICLIKLFYKLDPVLLDTSNDSAIAVEMDVLFSRIIV